MRALYWTIFLVAVAACDPSAKSEARGEAAANRLSLSYETCARTSDCAGQLRCVDAVCVSPTGSVLGEFYTEVAARAARAGRHEETVDAFATAVKNYDKEKLEPPADLYCRYGSALVAMPELTPQRADLAARVLHKCVLGSPAGSALRRKAMTGLSALVERGLDPALIARGEDADQYMTKEPLAPPVDDLQVEISLESGSRSSSIAKLTEGLKESGQVKPALAACWQKHYQRTHDDVFIVELPIRYGFELTQYDDFKSSWAKLADAAPPTDANKAAAVECARAALGPIIEAAGAEVGREARWEATATFTMGPG